MGLGSGRTFSTDPPPTHRLGKGVQSHPKGQDSTRVQSQSQPTRQDQSPSPIPKDRTRLLKLPYPNPTRPRPIPGLGGGHLGSHWPVRESGVPLRLQREPAALAGASRGLSGGSDHHQQAEEECASGPAAGASGSFVFRLLSLPPSGPSHGTVLLPASSACSGRWSACRSVFCLVARP